jgi:hypothetical protein
MMLLGCCWMRICELINGSVHLYSISFLVAVAADTLYHVKVALENSMGITP